MGKILFQFKALKWISKLLLELAGGDISHHILRVVSMTWALNSRYKQKSMNAFFFA